MTTETRKFVFREHVLLQYHGTLKCCMMKKYQNKLSLRVLNRTAATMAAAVDDAETYTDLHRPALLIASCFVVPAIFLSVFLILHHLRSYNNPAEQKWIVAIVFMVPVYATESFISLWNPKFSLACDILRNCYEAFALYSFGSYLIACLGGETGFLEFLEQEEIKQLGLLRKEDENIDCAKRKKFRDFFLQPRLVGKELFSIEKFGIVQYMILKTLCGFLAFLLEIFGVYGNGEFKWYYGYPYITIVLNFSQMWALYCLVQLYEVAHERLRPIRPLEKFISFKAIVFATWWQGVGIALLCAFKVLPEREELQTGLQDFLICIEMAVAAVAHVFVFSTEPYRYNPPPEYESVSSEKIETSVKVESDNEEKEAMIEETETRIEAPGTSITESVHDVVIDGGQHVVQDVVLTINQAIGPMEKGVMRIQEKFHRRHTSSSDEEELEIKEQLQESLCKDPQN